MSAEKLSAQITRRGMTVISGLARGIDTAAHRGALSAKGRTIAVLGSGLDKVYPPENRQIAAKIAESGALISEFPLGTGPNRQNFPMRNRIISGLSLGVIVVEAARKSGSLITAAQALDQGRVVFAVPGRIDSYSSNGAHALIKDGAKLVESVDDICEEFPYLFFDATAGDRKTGADRPPMPELSGEEELVYNCVSREETPIDDITMSCGIPPSRVSAALLSLEIKRLIIQLPGKLFQKRF
jgi:DNA processing protein